MNTISIGNICPKCGAVIAADAPQGLCPRCVLAGAATSTDAGLKPGERPAAPPLATVAAAFPQLEIIELIGQGGMGVVYKARQPKLDRLVALKLLPAALGADPAFAERFQREAKFLARLSHPNIVSVHDFGQSGGFCYLLLEYVDGVNLRQAMQAGRFSPAEALAIVPGICGALQYAHDQGVLHRDIKPENILLDARGAVKLADFGIAKLVREPGDTRADVTLTQSGARLGTPHYMAPEQIEKPSEVDHRADIYSLGVVFYELLTGELPLGRFAPPSEKADLDARVDAIVFRALAKERELRQQSAGEVKTEVEGVTSTPRDRREGTSAPAPLPPLKISSGYLTTPEKFGTFTGQFFLYRNPAQFILDPRQLTCSLHGTTTVIPLAAIRDLSIGRYPRVMNFAAIHFISVTYEENGQSRRLFLSPSERTFGFPSGWNQRAEEWFHAIRDAAHAATGRVPQTTPLDRLEVPPASRGIYAAWLLPLLIVVLASSLVLRSGPGTSSLLERLAYFFGFTLGFGLVLAMALKAGRVILGGPGGSGLAPVWRRRLGWLSLALAGLSYLTAISYITFAPERYRATAQFRAEGSSSSEVIAAFTATIATNHRAVEFRQINNTSMYAIYGYGFTAEEAARNANEAFAAFERVTSAKPELIDHAFPPPRPHSPNRLLSLVLGFLGLTGFGLLGMGLLRHERSGATERDQNPAPAPNPWPHRLFWLVLGLTLLPLAAVTAALVAPRLLGSPLRGAGGLLAGIIPLATGALLVIGFLRTRPTAAQAQPRSQWNPWPQRFFWVVLGLVVAPALLLFVSMMVPRVVVEQRAPIQSFVIPQAVTTMTNQFPSMGGMGAPLQATESNAAAFKFSTAHQRLEDLRKRVKAGIITPEAPEYLGAERDEAIADAEFRNEWLLAAEIRVLYAQKILDYTHRRFASGATTQDELNDALAELEQAFKAREKLAPAPAPAPTSAPR
jgi:serine/threonine protein kinase